MYAQGEEAVIGLVEGLLDRIDQLEGRVTVLENQLSKNSRNSSKPPSGDGFGQRTCSLRSKSEGPSGGQAEHPGQTLEWSDEVDWIVEHRASQCQGCGARLDDAPVGEVIARQVQDLPALGLEVSEHQAEVKYCPVCGLRNQGRFPAEVSHRVQYGPVVKGVMVWVIQRWWAVAYMPIAGVLVLPQTTVNRSFWLRWRKPQWIFCQVVLLAPMVRFLVILKKRPKR